MQYPDLQESHIRDKNKVDRMFRLITLIQTLWFIANLIARPSQGLAITVLELSTSAFVIFGVAITLCWMRKPADVQEPDYIRTDKTIAEILLEAGEQAAGIYNNTPLDFVGTRIKLSSKMAHRGTAKRKTDWSVSKHRCPCH
jgi:hypothetical protein